MASPPTRWRRRGGGFKAGLAAAATAFIAACTLISDDFEPPVIEDGALLPDSGASAEVVCGAGLQCCADWRCPLGSFCRDGRCGTVDVGDAGPSACTGSDCPSDAALPLAASCDDGQRNDDETGPDCGGSCPGRCALDVGCRIDADCAGGLYCSAEGSRCSQASCGDGLLNGNELLADCGGGICPGCVDGSPCNESSDCLSRICGDGGTCSPPSCTDATQNQDETAVDCGGSCPLDCADGAGCSVAGDCASGACGTANCADGVSNCCQAPACDDGVRNGAESDLDCGTPACASCAVGARCELDAQCQTDQCLAGVCSDAPSCDDNVQNGTETGLDCGGGCPSGCPDRSACNQDADCASNNCDPSGTCISCGDGVQNGTETDIDCGGADAACRRCNGGERCQGNPDCASQFCLGGSC